MTGNRIKEAREAANMTQAELAEMAGITRVSLSRIETGANPNPSVQTAIRIAKTLGVSMDFLFLQ